MQHIFCLFLSSRAFSRSNAPSALTLPSAGTACHGHRAPQPHFATMGPGGTMAPPVERALKPKNAALEFDPAGFRGGRGTSVVLPRNPNSGELSSDEASTSEQSDSRRHSVQDDDEQVNTGILCRRSFTQFRDILGLFSLANCLYFVIFYYNY